MLITISAVIPTHDRDELLRMAVQSAVTQSGDLAEVIVVDDVGREQTRQVVEELSSEACPVRYVHNAEGAGASSSRNLGANHASGSYVAFLDDDDEWKDGYLHRVVTEIQATQAPVVFTQLDQFWEAGRALPTHLTSSEILATNPGVSGSNIVMDREAFLALGGFDSSMWVSNDKDFLVRFLDTQMPYAVVPEPLVHWRSHTAGRLTRPSRRRLDGLEAYYAKYEDRLTWRDKRKLLGVIANTRRHLEQGRISQLKHVTIAVALLGPGPFVGRLLRRRLR